LLTGSADARLAIEAGDDPRTIAEAVSAVDPGWTTRMREAARAVAASQW
jgi:hypothetical protein